MKKQNYFFVILMLGSFASPLCGQTTAQIQEKQIVVSYDQQERPYYKTLDGNIRYFNNPSEEKSFSEKGYQRLSYALGATQSPYNNRDDIKNQTKGPLDLCDTDFFSNFVNAKGSTDTFIKGRTTGNPCYNYKEYEDFKGVPYGDEEHWNIQRFLINPHFGKHFKIPINTAMMNVAYDLYRYFLYQNRDLKDSRDKSWNQTLNFMVYVESIVNGKAQAWLKGNINELDDQNEKRDKKYYLEVGTSLYNKDGRPDFLYSAINHNGEVSEGFLKNSKKLFTKTEIVDFLINYNIEYRRKSLTEAKRIVMQNVEDAENYYKDEIKKCRDEKYRYIYKKPPEGMVDVGLLQEFYAKDENIIGKEKITPTEDEVRACEQRLKLYVLK